MTAWEALYETANKTRPNKIPGVFLLFFDILIRYGYGWDLFKKNKIFLYGKDDQSDPGLLPDLAALG